MNTLSFLLAIIAFSLPTSAFAAQAGLHDFFSPAHIEALEVLHAAIPRWTSVDLKADCRSILSCTVSENAQRIKLNGARTSWGRFSFSGSAGDQPISLSASPDSSSEPGRGYNFLGSLVNLSLRPSGNGYWLTGSMGHRNVSIMFNRFGSGWSMFGQNGLNLSLSGVSQSLTASGSVDAEKYGPYELAAFGSVLAVLNTLPSPSARTGAGLMKSEQVYDRCVKEAKRTIDQELKNIPHIKSIDRKISWLSARAGSRVQFTHLYYLTFKNLTHWSFQYTSTGVMTQADCNMNNVSKVGEYQIYPGDDDDDSGND